MSKYLFHCKKCNISVEKIVSYDKRNEIPCDQCNDIMIVKPSVTLINIVNELVDCYKNKAIKKDINKIMKKREIDHVSTYELKEYVEKHGLETMKKTNYFKNKKGKIV